MPEAAPSQRWGEVHAGVLWEVSARGVAAAPLIDSARPARSAAATRTWPALCEHWATLHRPRSRRARRQSLGLPLDPPVVDPPPFLIGYALVEQPARSAAAAIAAGGSATCCAWLPAATSAHTCSCAQASAAVLHHGNSPQSVDPRRLPHWRRCRCAAPAGGSGCRRRCRSQGGSSLSSRRGWSHATAHCGRERP